MIQTTSYTPLESLLLFTWIRTRGAEAFEATTFPRVSHDLINNETIKQDPTYDAARLTPEFLQELFLHLLHEELKDEALVNESVIPDGSLSPNSNSRQRLGSVPKVTSLVEARQHAHRLPDAEAKLFAKYKQKVAQELWQEQEELCRLEQEISQLELKQKQFAQARKTNEVRNEANGSPIVNANSVTEATRSPTTAPTGEGWKPPAQPNGAAPQAQPPLPAQVNVPNNFSPAPQVPSIRPSATPPSHPPLVQQPPTTSPSPLGQGPVGPQEPARVPSTPAPVLQLPQNLHPPASFPSHPVAAPTPVNEALQKPAHVLPKTDTPVQASQSPQLSASGSLKWEPPYQPHHGPHQQPLQPLQHIQPQQHPQQQPQVQLQQQPQIPQRAPPNVPHLTPQQQQHYPPSWNAQPPLHFSHTAPLLPPQASAQPQTQQSARPILVAPHPGAQQPPLQPAPSRSHSGSPVPLQRPVGTPSPLSGPVRLPRSPYQHTQQVFAPPQPLPPAHNRIVPTVNSTPSPRLPPATPQHAQWSKPPTPQQAVHSGSQPGQPAFSIPTGPPIPQSPAYNSPYPQPARPALPPHTMPQQQQQQQQQQQAPIVGPSMRRPHPVLPQTPLTMPFYSRPQGSGTKWTTAQPTPSTPEPIVGELQSPAFEPLSPVAQPISLPARTLKKPEKPTEPESSNTEEVANPLLADSMGPKRSPSVASQRDEPSQVDAESATKVKREDATPRPLEDPEDTTADESVSGRRQPASPRNPRASGKRKRQDSVTSDQRAASEFRPRLQPPPPPGIPTHVLWTRGFPRVSNSALEQIQSHKHANMFQNRIRPKEAPGYDGIIYKPQYLKNIQKAINAGHKAAAATAAALPGGDPGTSSVWLPISEDLVPPRAIINSAQLERELVQMFANAIMYNLDPNRGPGPAFMKGSGVGEKGANEAHGRVQSHAAGDTPNMIGYKVDENSVVKDTQSMFAEVDKLLIELRSTEAQPGVPPAPLPPGAVPASERLARGSVVTMADTEQTPASGVGGSFAAEEADEQQTDREGDGTSGNVKRRRLGRA